MRTVLNNKCCFVDGDDRRYGSILTASAGAGNPDLERALVGVIALDVNCRVAASLDGGLEADLEHSGFAGSETGKGRGSDFEAGLLPAFFRDVEPGQSRRAAIDDRENLGRTALAELDRAEAFFRPAVSEIAADGLHD